MKNIDLAIVPECYADTLLIETLTKPPIGKYNHQKGCKNVQLTVRDKLVEMFAVGIVDKDKKQLAYLDCFEEIAAVQDLFLYRHRDYPKPQHYFIVIQPAVEVWILKACNELEISPKDFNLPEELVGNKGKAGFRDITKTLTSLQNENLKSLFREMRKKSAASSACAVATLIKWVTLLRDKNYHVQPGDFHSTK